MNKNEDEQGQLFATDAADTKAQEKNKAMATDKTKKAGASGGSGGGGETAETMAKRQREISVSEFLPRTATCSASTARARRC